MLQHPLRVAGRSLWLAAEMALGLGRFASGWMRGCGRMPLEARTRWLQHLARRTLRIFNAELIVNGCAPTRGLLVSNHLSYLDILVLAAQAPVVFVAKSEVARWPGFGWFARLAGTRFIHRAKRADVARVRDEIRDLLDAGALVVLFAEGTSSDGRQVLPLKASLLEPALNQKSPICLACVQYALADGDPAEEVCYWKEMTLVPHLLNLFSKRRVLVALRYQPSDPSVANRKELARELHAELTRLREEAENDLLNLSAARSETLSSVPMVHSPAPALARYARPRPN